MRDYERNETNELSPYRRRDDRGQNVGGKGLQTIPSGSHIFGRKIEMVRRSVKCLAPLLSEPLRISPSFLVMNVFLTPQITQQKAIQYQTISRQWRFNPDTSAHQNRSVLMQFASQVGTREGASTIRPAHQAGCFIGRFDTRESGSRRSTPLRSERRGR